MAKAFDKLLLGENSARAYDVSLELFERVHLAPLNRLGFALYYVVRNHGERESSVKVKVESSSDSKGQEFPSRFLLGTRPIEVRSVVDRWYGEQACYYRVIGDDENYYILKGPLEDNTWELVSFTHKDSRGTELEYEGKRELQ